MLSVGLAERGDADGVSSTVGVMRSVGPSDETDAEQTTHRSRRARRGRGHHWGMRSFIAGHWDVVSSLLDKALGVGY